MPIFAKVSFRQFDETKIISSIGIMEQFDVFFKRAKNGIYVCNCCNNYFDSREDAVSHLENSYIEGFCEGGIRRNLISIIPLEDEYECVCGKKDGWYEILAYHHDLLKTTCVTEYLRKQDSYCDICDLQCVSVFDFKKHCNTIKHAKRKAGYVTLPLHCDICNVTFPSQGHIRKHLETKKHKNMVDSGKVADERISLHCDTCNITCPSQATIRKHLQTKKHAKLASVNNIRERINTQ
jgi:Zinc-finger of C2H2 type